MLKLLFFILLSVNVFADSSVDLSKAMKDQKLIVRKEKVVTKPIVQHSSKLRVYFSKEEVKSRISDPEQELDKEIVYLQRNRRPSHYHPNNLQLRAAALANLGEEYIKKLSPIRNCPGLDHRFKCRTDDNSCVFELKNSNCKFARDCDSREGFLPQPLPKNLGKTNQELCVRTETLAPLSGAKR